MIEPKTEMMETYRCPKCGQLFMKREYYDRHARGCGKAVALLGKCVRWSERLDAYTAEYMGRVVDVYCPEPDIDPYTLEDNTGPITVIVIGFRKDAKKAEMDEYDLEPEGLEVIHDSEFEEWYIGMAMRDASKELDGIRKEAEDNMMTAGLMGPVNQEAKE